MRPNALTLIVLLLLVSCTTVSTPIPLKAETDLPITPSAQPSETPTTRFAKALLMPTEYLTLTAPKGAETVKIKNAGIIQSGSGPSIEVTGIAGYDTFALPEETGKVRYVGAKFLIVNEGEGRVTVVFSDAWGASVQLRQLDGDR